MHECPISRRHALALLSATALLPLRKSLAAISSTEKDAADPLYYLSLEEMARRIATREISPVAITQQMLTRIASVDPVLKSYATLMSDQALADARTAEKEIQAGQYRGPLHGMPIGVKDLCYTKGVRTMGGTKVLQDFIPTFDATVVTKLRAAGAVILGKLNLSEGATAGYNPARDVPLNPWNHDRWPGMSSSGSGVESRRPLSCVPFLLARSSSSAFPSVTMIRAWILETLVESNQDAAAPSRPSTFSPSFSAYIRPPRTRTHGEETGGAATRGSPSTFPQNA